MAGDRRAATKVCLEYIEKIAPGSPAAGILEEYFKKMSDVEFDKYINDLESGKQHLVYYAPNFITKISVKNNIAIAKELGHSFLQKLYIGPSSTSPKILTPITFLVCKLPVCAQSQTLAKKLSTPGVNTITDTYTGQVAGDDAAAGLSYPEIQILASMGMDKTTIELAKYRGGDRKGLVAYNAMLSRYGSVSLNSIAQFSSGVESTKTLSVYLTGMHLRNNLFPKMI